VQWEVVGAGALRFRGKENVRKIMDLLDGDKNYTWSVPRMSTPLWIDVYPRNPEAQNLLLELVGK
jgi:hypothetical protein